MLWYQLNKNQIENELETDLEKGLSLEEVQKRFQSFGPNQLPDTPPESLFLVFARQFKSPLIYVLVACAAAVYFMGEPVDAIIIVAVLLFNAIIGAVQEGRSQQTLQSLKKLSFAETTVIRQGEEFVIPEREVVPGDVIVLQEGQKVTADARVLLHANLSVDESALTGESGGVPKHERALTEADLPAASQSNMVFKGTSILAGNARAVAVATGLHTEIGKISKALLEPEVEIPLQRNIRKLSQVIIIAIGIISVALFGVGLMFGRGAVEMFGVVVSLAVSMIPEGLPLVLTLILVTGVWRMSKRNALVKKLQAVEALGQANVLAVDKTGTITRNEMVIKKLYTCSTVFSVSGDGYAPSGDVQVGNHLASKDPRVEWMATLAGLSSDAAVLYVEKEGKYKVSGDPTEAAMAVLAEKLGFTRAGLLKRYRKLAETPFDSKNKYRTTFYEHGKEVLQVVAGAPEVLIDGSSRVWTGHDAKAFHAEERKRVIAAQEEFSERGLRVVAVGFKHAKHDALEAGIDDLIFTGLFAIEDQVRPEAVAAVRLAQAAGLKVVMITGDHKVTARAIAREAGIYRDGDMVLTGAELKDLPVEALSAQLERVSVFSRIAPEDKMKIIKAYRESGFIVAMTGDGVNDAPPLVAADLGVAMGKIGTEVAKDAADIVLLDDNLSSIVAAIEEGRAMHKNIQKALLFLFSTSVGELLTIVLALFLHMPMPVLAAQILWLNLITDPLIGMAMALDNKEPDLLSKKQDKLPKYFITKTMLLQMVLIGLTMAGGTLYLFSLYHPVDYFRGVTVSLTVLAVYQWYNGFNCRSGDRTVFSRQLFSNGYLWLALLGNVVLQLLAVYSPPFQAVLKTTPLSFQEWLVIGAVASSVILVEELRKLLFLLIRKISSPKTATVTMPATSKKI